MGKVKFGFGLLGLIMGFLLIISAGWIAVVYGIVDFGNIMKDPAVTFSFFSVAWLLIKVWGGSILLGILGVVACIGGALAAISGWRDWD